MIRKAAAVEANDERNLKKNGRSILFHVTRLIQHLKLRLMGNERLKIYGKNLN